MAVIQFWSQKSPFLLLQLPKPIKHPGAVLVTVLVGCMVLVGCVAVWMVVVGCSLATVPSLTSADCPQPQSMWHVALHHAWPLPLTLHGHLFGSG
jgi:hypothetical protein